MFVICFLVCFIIQGDLSLGQDVDITDSGKADALPAEDSRENPLDNFIEGRADERLIKGKLKLITKAFMLLKLLFFVVSLPLSAITAKILSWNAVALSLLAFITSKLVLLRSMFLGQSSPSVMPPNPPIIIQSSSEPLRRFRTGPKIYIQPDVHIPEPEEEPHRRKRWYRFVNRCCSLPAVPESWPV